MEEPTMAIAARRHEPPAIEVRVNFGVFAGREATSIELERLATYMLDEVGEVSIISEERHEVDSQVEASIHQVRIEVAGDLMPDGAAEQEALEQRILERAEYWAHTCVAERHIDVELP
jgi:hypothetical protein